MAVLRCWVSNPRSAVVFGLVRPSGTSGFLLFLSLALGVRLGVGRLASELGGRGPAPWLPSGTFIRCLGWTSSFIPLRFAGNVDVRPLPTALGHLG